MKLFIIVGLAIAGVGYYSASKADCYTRSNIRLSYASMDAGPTDIQRLVVPDTRGQKCVVRYRVNIGGDWQTAEGSAVAKTDAEACTRAMDVGRGMILADVEPSRISTDTQMVCSDLPDIRVRPVRIGETIWESETDLHSIPQERKYFWYKRTKCRLFQERNPRDRNLIVYQGVICQANGTPNSKWQVVDKF